MVLGNTVVPPEQLMEIPVGSVILVGKALPGAKVNAEEASSVWFVYSEGKAELVNSKFPNSETEDLDWFTRWEVTIIGRNEEYACNYVKAKANYSPVSRDLGRPARR